MITKHTSSVTHFLSSEINSLVSYVRSLPKCHVIACRVLSLPYCHVVACRVRSLSQCHAIACHVKSLSVSGRCLSCQFLTSVSCRCLPVRSSGSVFTNELSSTLNSKRIEIGVKTGERYRGKERRKRWDR